MEGTQRQLERQPEAVDACQLVVWFTDGAIDLEGGAQVTADALNDLCGQPIDPAGHAPAQGFGLFSAFRQSGVVVMGTLLAAGSTRRRGRGHVAAGRRIGRRERQPAAVRPARSSDDGGTRGGGRRLRPERARAGVPGTGEPDRRRLPRAPRRRGQVLDRSRGLALPARLGGEDWSLVAPDGFRARHLTADSPGPATVTPSAGATLVEVPIDDDEFVGQMAADLPATSTTSTSSATSRSCSATQNEIELGEDGATAATLTAQVSDAEGDRRARSTSTGPRTSRRPSSVRMARSQELPAARRRPRDRGDHDSDADRCVRPREIVVTASHRSPGHRARTASRSRP